MIKKSFFVMCIAHILIFLTVDTLASSLSLPRVERVTSAVLMSADSGQIVFEQNADHRVNPGALIQLMTLELVMEALEEGSITFDTTIQLPHDAQHVKKVFYSSGQKVKLFYLLESIAVVNAHDACIAVADHLADSRNDFIELMNEKAKQLGLSSTLIGDTCGRLKDTNRQHSTAKDMAQLAYYHIKKHPELSALYPESHFSFKGTHYKNRNYLLDYDEHIDGLKCAQLNDRTFHLIATCTRGDARYLAVITGAKSRKKSANQAVKLLYQGFTNFENVTLFDQGDEIAKTRIWKGKIDYIPLVSRQSVIVTVPKNMRHNISAKKKTVSRLYAPVTTDEKVGTLQVALREEVVKNIDLYPSLGVQRAHFFKQIWHSIILMFKK
jgi:D-alanyl-D-alanine carboxypeptidase (penicillin-binding protein 5/6)